MTEAVYLDDRLSRAVDVLWLATLKNARALINSKTRDAALDNISALWAAFDSADLATLHRFVQHWDDPRAEHVYKAVVAQGSRPEAIATLNRDDHNRLLAYVLHSGHPPATWRAADWEADSNPGSAQAVRDNIAAGHVSPKPWDR